MVGLFFPTSNQTIVKFFFRFNSNYRFDGIYRFLMYTPTSPQSTTFLFCLSNETRLLLSGIERSWVRVTLEEKYENTINSPNVEGFKKEKEKKIFASIQ